MTVVNLALDMVSGFGGHKRCTSFWAIEIVRKRHQKCEPGSLQ